jgi:uncharacterized protein YbjQ (UPF0145 family)
LNEFNLENCQNKNKKNISKKNERGRNNMMVTTTETLPGREVKEVLGVVFGSCVQTKHLGKDLRAAGRTLIGGENRSYTELVEEARRLAMQRMITDAKKLKADAIIGMRYATAQTMGSAAEIIAFGTAVKTF